MLWLEEPGLASAAPFVLRAAGPSGLAAVVLAPGLPFLTAGLAVVDDALAADGAEGVLVLDGVEVALVPVDVEVVLAPVDVEGVFAAERSALGGIVDQLRWLGWAKDDYVLEMPRSTINTMTIWQT